MRIFAASLNAGADKISMNSSAVANPQLVKDAADKYGLAVHCGGDWMPNVSRQP